MGLLIRTLACVVGACLALTLPIAAHADEAMMSLPRDTHISAFKGTLAWSQFDAATGNYRLMLTDVKSGRTTMPKIAWRKNPFDVTLGPDTKGRTVALYSHCDKEGNGESGNGDTGCDAYRYDLRTKKETKLPFNVDRDSEEWPAQWYGQYSYVEVRVGGTAYQLEAANRCDRVLSSKKDAYHTRLNAHGTCGIVTGQVLRGTTVAQTVVHTRDPIDGKARKYTELRILSTKGGAGTRLLLSKFTDGSDGYSSPAIDSKYVYAVRTGAAITPRFVRVSLKTRKVDEVEAQTPLTDAMARDGNTIYYLEQPGDPGAPLTPCATATPCRLVRSDQDVFGPAQRTLAPRLTLQFPPDPVFGNLPMPVSGALTQAVVRQGKVVGSSPLGGVALEGLIAGYPGAGNELTLTSTGRTATTGADGTWSLTIPPPLTLGGQYVVITRSLPVPVQSAVGTLTTYSSITLTATPGGPGKVIFSGTVEPADQPGRILRIKVRQGSESSAIADAQIAPDGHAFSVEANATVGYTYFADLPPDPGYLTGDVKLRTGTSPDLTVTTVGGTPTP